MRSGATRGLALLVVVAGAFSACFDPPILPPPSANFGLAGESPAEAGEPSKPDGGAAEPAGGRAGATSTGGAGGQTVGGSDTAGKTGAGGAPLTVTWLDLDGDRAPSTEATNAALGIEGSFYAYRDDCAELEWDPATRCAHGKLCQPGVDFENWGVAVGFDLDNTGESGEPPNTKLLWDPRDVGVKGFAWRITGTAPAAQLWVLNMDSRFGGACPEQTCEIAGPPDGDDAISLTGQLLFASMEKDDWGGGGLPYDFDPALVHALQLKLPTVRARGESFDFCIEALGVVR